jgi:hypothetical protein
MTAAVNVCLVHPPGWLHVEAFREVAEMLLFGARRIGRSAEILVNRVPAAGVSIVLGAHLLPPDDLHRLPGDAILYNLEQLEGAVSRLPPGYVERLSGRTVWDYSRRNVAHLAERGIVARRVPIGYVPELSRIPAAPAQDIDVLFYGVVNRRRAAVLDRLSDAGVTVAAASRTYGAERDAMIARAKLVLNLHHYDDGHILEIVRVSYLLANRKAVVAERGPATEVEGDLDDALAFAPYGGLADACRTLLADDSGRRALAERGFERFAARDQAAILREALG